MWKIFALCFLVYTASAGATKCLGLALEGGGSWGAYQAGAVKAFTELIKPLSDMEYDIITGVSTGSLNAFGFSMFPKGQEVEMANYIHGIWYNITADDVYTPNKPMAWNALFGKSVLSNDALRNTVKKIYNDQGPIARNLTIGTTNYDIGQFQNFDQSVGEEMVEGVICSSAIPVIFPLQSWQGAHYADGGCITNLDIFSAVEKCLATVEDESDVYIDAVFCSDDKIKKDPKEDWKSYDILWRQWQIYNYDLSMWLLYQAKMAYPNVNFRYIVKPTVNFPGGEIPLDFDHQVILDELTDGYNDAKEVIDTYGKVGNANEVIDEWMASRKQSARS